MKQRKYDHFLRALNNLHDIFQKEEPCGNIETAGMVALFQICFEQSWKAMKEILEDYGYGAAKTGSPKSVIKTAYQAHMIDNEALWLEALDDRNNVAHSYNAEAAKAMIRRAKEQYYQMFSDLRESLERDWLS